MSGRVLIADSNDTQRKALALELSEACYDVRAVTSEPALWAAVSEAAPDVLLIDADAATPDVLRHLRTCRGGEDTAVVGMAATASGRIQALKIGLDDTLVRPLGGAMLQARLRNHIRSIQLLRKLRRNRIAASDYGCAEAAAQWQPAVDVALIAPDSRLSDTLAAALSGTKLRRMTAGDILTVDRVAGTAPAVIVVSIGPSADGVEGLRLLAELRSRTATRRSAILAIVRSDDTELATMALDLGADDILLGLDEPQELRLRVSRLILRKAELDALRAPVEESLRLAAIDDLTGLFNRRYAINAMRTMEREAGRPGGDVAVMIADLDNFKSVNDRFGHPTGDAVLAEVARRLRDQLRSDDLLARFGGEEFLIILRGASSRQARSAADRLCKAIRGLTAPLETQAGGQPITVSIGVAVGRITPEPGNLDALRCAADAALYAAKSAGRDCVRVAKIDLDLSPGSGGQNAA